MKPYYEQDGITIYHGDCREVLPYIGGGDVVVTDPPFNVAKDYGDDSADNMSIEAYREMIRWIVCQGPERQAWIAPKIHLPFFMDALGVDARLVIVRRGAIGPLRWGWYDQFDTILVRGKPNRRIYNLWDDIRLKGEGYFFREETFDHPGYTPLPIMLRLISILSEPGQLVVEPFCGTGTTLVAAKQCGCRAVGIEQNKRYCEIAANRLAQGVLFGAEGAA